MAFDVAWPAILIVTLSSESLATLAVLYSLARPARRLWPPPRMGAPSGRWMVLFFGLSGAGVIALGVGDWGSLPLPSWSRWFVGLPLWAGGNGLALWAMVALGVRPTLGSEGTLVHRGPYRFSRHPQYAGFVVALVGWPLVATSGLAVAPSLVAIAPLWLASVAEERWLAERHGDAYEAYRGSTPRLLSLRRSRGDPTRR